MVVSKNGLFIMKNPKQKWIIGGTPILENHHIYIYTHTYLYNYTLFKRFWTTIPTWASTTRFTQEFFGGLEADCVVIKLKERLVMDHP